MQAIRNITARSGIKPQPRASNPSVLLGMPGQNLPGGRNRRLETSFLRSGFKPQPQASNPTVLLGMLGRL